MPLDFLMSFLSVIDNIIIFIIWTVDWISETTQKYFITNIK